MAARAYWSGQLRLALVSIPVEVYPATRSGAAISFRQIHKPSGKPIRYQKVAPGVGEVEPEDIARGYEVAKGDYVLLEDSELDAVKIESRKTLELVQFVDAHEIDVLYYEKPYFVVPADELADEAYAVLREALRKTKKVGLGQLSVRGREQFVSIKPCGDGIVLEILRYADEVQKAQTYFRNVAKAKPPADLVDLATNLIEQKAAPFDPAKFTDHYVEAVQRLAAKKAKSHGKRVLEDVVESASGGRSNVIDLMAALKKSLGDEKKPAAKAAPKSTAAKRPASRARKSA
jgi:DNA end-binding protein Ku